MFGDEHGAAVAALLAEPLADELTRGGALRFGALLHDIAKPQTREVTPRAASRSSATTARARRSRAGFCTRLRASERLRAHVAALTRHHLRLGFLVHERPLDRARRSRLSEGCEPVEVDVTLLSVADRLATRGRERRRGDRGAPRARTRADRPGARMARARAARAARARRRAGRRARDRGGPQLGRLLAELEEAAYAGEVGSHDDAIELARSGLRVTARELNRRHAGPPVLLERETTSVVDAVDRLGGLQAQEPRPPFVALWSRLEGFERDELGAALQQGPDPSRDAVPRHAAPVSRKRYAALRPALDDVMTRAMTGALKGRDEGLDLASCCRRREKLLDKAPADVQRAARRAQRAVPEGQRACARLRRPDAAAAGDGASDDAWALPARGRVRTGRREAAQARPEALCSPPGRVRPGLRGRRPALVGRQGIKPVLDGLREQLVTFKDGRRELFDLPDAPRPGEDVEAPPRFLPDFDSLVLAHDDRTRMSPTSTSRRSPRRTCASRRWSSGTASRPGRGGSSASAASRR